VANEERLAIQEKAEREGSAILEQDQKTSPSKTTAAEIRNGLVVQNLRLGGLGDWPVVVM